MTETQPAFKPWTPEEIVDLVSSSDVAISPDGGLVAFTVAPGSKKGEHQERTIWLSRNGAAAAPFTTGLFDDNSPVWSPDGSQLAFLSDRKERGKERLYLISPNGGEARPLGDLEGELSSPAFSPDGSRIAVLRKDPETDEEKKRKEDKDDPIVVEEQPKFTRLWVVEIATGKARCLTFGDRNVYTFGWSPDGSQLAIGWTTGPEVNAHFLGTTVDVIPSGGGLSRTLFTGMSSPGKLAFAEADGTPVIVFDREGDYQDPASSIWTVPLNGSAEPRNLLPGYAGQVYDFAQLPDMPGSIVVRITEGTHGNLYRLDLSSGALTPVTPSTMHGAGSVTAGPSASRDGSKLAFIWSDGDRAPEVFVASAGGEATSVSGFGTAVNPRLLPVTQVTWLSDGIEIEGHLTLPHGYEEGQRYPLIVEVHGGPSWQWEDRLMLSWHDWAQFLASHGFAVLAPNPRGSTGRGSDFQKLLFSDVGGGEVRDLVNGAQAMVERGVADPDRLGIGGWSWGGYLTATTITKSTIFKAAVMGAGLSNLISDHGTDDIPNANLLYFPGHPYEHLDLYWEGSAIRNVTACVTPTLIVHGDADDRVPPSQGAEMYRALKVRGVPVQFVRYPREPHGFRERNHQIDLQKRILAWYQKYL